MNENMTRASNKRDYERLVDWYGAGLLSNRAMADLANLIAAAEDRERFWHKHSTK